MPDTTLKGDGRDLLRIVLPAAARGDLDSVRRFVKADPWWVFRIGPHGRTMLWEAAYKKRVETVRFLIDCGANVNQLGTYYTPLRVDLSPYALAQKAGHDELSELLSGAGALVDAHTAAYLGELETLERFLKQSPELANAEPDIFSGKPLKVADVGFNKRLSTAIECVEDRIEEVFAAETDRVHELLGSKKLGNSKKNDLALGFDTEFYERHRVFGQLILDLINGRHTSRNRAAAIRQIHRRWRGHVARWRKQFEYYKPPAYVDVILHYAVEGGYIDAVKLLIEYGANVQVVGKSLLHQCLNARPMMNLLIQHGAKVGTVANSDWIGDEQLERLAERHSTKLDIDARADGKYPPLVEACRGNHNAPDEPCRVQSILDRGAKINIKDYKGKTGLHRAAQANFTKIGKLLCDSGADLEALDDEGETPIFDAVRRGRLETAKLLLKRGVSVDITNSKGRSLLEIARRGKKADSEAILKLIKRRIKQNAS